jgi:acyl-CoA synthetase (AMP-forming)/AMP-acid ligase II
MDASRPARVDPRKFVDAIGAWKVTQSFGSPAIWRRVGDYCAAREIRLPTLRRVMSAGAPVPPDVLATMKSVIAPDGLMHTPYGATEALPVATIEAGEVLAETAARTRQGAGTCVGRRFGGIRWKVIAEEVEPAGTPRPLRTLDDARELPNGQIGELIVSGEVVTRAYTTRTEWNERTKLADGDRFWHRMGDVGYLDDQDRFWYCGRMSHRVVTAGGVMYTDPCEGIFNGHPEVFRSALVGVPDAAGGPYRQPVIVCELRSRARSRRTADFDQLGRELGELAMQHAATCKIETFLFHPKFPVDVRHNAKIGREQLAVWAAGKLGRS